MSQPFAAYWLRAYGGSVTDNGGGGGDGNGNEQIGQFAEQARWLIAYHDSRGESLSSRAVALLGFAGVILALLLQAKIPDGVGVDWWLALTFAATVVGLLVTSARCLRTMKSRRMQVPGAEQTRRQWRDYVMGDRKSNVAANITETYLSAKDLSKDSTLDSVAASADSRAEAFDGAVRAMVFSLGALSALLATVGLRVFF